MELIRHPAQGSPLPAHKIGSPASGARSFLVRAHAEGHFSGTCNLNHMMWLRQIIARRRLSTDLSAEIQQHLDEKVEELVATGMPPEEAIHCARREFGNVARMEEQGREVWAWPWIENRLADLSFAFRQMRREPLFSLVSCLSIALGIGATTLMFSVVYSVLINPYPYKDA